MSDRSTRFGEDPVSTTSPDDASLVVGLDIGGTNIRLVVANLQGRVLARMSQAIGVASTPQQIVVAVKTYIRKLFEETGLPITQLKAIGAGVPGITNLDTGVVKAAPFLSEWKDVPFRAMLEEQLHVPAVVENDVNLAALGEATAGNARGEKDFIFLAIGTGFGAGIMLRGKLHHGADWAAGEVGYLRLCGGSEAIDDDIGPLESLIGGPAIERAWRHLSAGTAYSMELSATDVFELAQTGVVPAVDLLEQTASLLSTAIFNISLVLNCPLFVLGGGVGSSEVLQRAIAKRLRLSKNLVNPRIEISSLGQDAQLIGAVKLALDMLDTSDALVLHSTSRH